MAWAPAWARAAAAAQEADGRRVFTVRARDFQFEPATLDARENDLVVIELDATDIPHSLVIDAYRIVKRASPGRPARFEFRADRVGTFAYYCNLTTDDRCKGMRGQLTVRPR
jgi:cytochrome c oxidase subunit 2